MLNKVKKFKATAAAILVSALFPLIPAHAIVLDFANLSGANINFNGNGTFDFMTNSSGGQFDLTSTGPSEGLDGYLTDTNLFTIKSISSPEPGEETASVSGSAILTIVDQSNVDLTGTVQFGTITTFYTAGILDLTGAIDLTDIIYSGSNSDLQALAAAGSASDVITFQFSSPMPLDELVDTSTNTSYSGTITAAAVPEPETFALFAAGLVGWLALCRRNRA